MSFRRAVLAAAASRFASAIASELQTLLTSEPFAQVAVSKIAHLSLVFLLRIPALPSLPLCVVFLLMNMEKTEQGKLKFLGFTEQQRTFSSAWNQAMSHTPSDEASTSLSQSSSSVVISSGASFPYGRHGHGHGDSFPCESSGLSGSVLKEHDYIGLAKVSSACSSVVEDGDAHPRDLKLEDTDLRLGLGPLQEDLAAFIVTQNKAQPPLELELLEPKDKGPHPDRTPATPKGAHLAFMNVFTSAAVVGPSKNGVKRAYFETLAKAMPSANVTSVAMKQLQGSDLKALSEYPQNVILSNWADPKLNGLYSNVNDNTRHDELPSQELASTDPPSAKGQVVGWPPIRSYRKNMVDRTHARRAVDEGDGLSAIYVKVNMDGIPIGRKVDLNAYSSYKCLFAALEEMFHSPSSGYGLHFLSNSEFVLTYEDKEGDWMLVGDVPWGMFVNTVRRLHIARGLEATGLAPRASKCNA